MTLLSLVLVLIVVGVLLWATNAIPMDARIRNVLRVVVVVFVVLWLVSGLAGHDGVWNPRLW